MTINAYLTFAGECRAAFEFYRTVFGGDFLFMQTFADGPADMPVPEEAKGLIMHVTLPVGGGVLMGSDTIEQFSPLPVTGTNFALSLGPDSKEQADELFAKLSDGGRVTMPMQDQFWGAYFGTCTDRFGIGWMINFETGGG
ncbi:MAG: VOC family protein [Spirochaetaceae bacterium]|nr:VOC family protein [Spirochaetaceae bacterium]MDE0227401.1 VOC family protein [Spirochaetaceae bacterium]MDE0448221.1 VOC family protein [Spirochaetaceae bacterium]